MIVETMNQEQNIKYLTSLLRNQEYTKLIHELRHDHEVDVALSWKRSPMMKRRLFSACCQKR